MKICATCKEEKPLSEYHKSARRKDGLHCYCKPCTRAHNRLWNLNNKEKHKASLARWYENNKERANLNGTKWHYKKHYGITYDDFLSLAQDQNNLCKLCSIPLTFGKAKDSSRAVLDHCHLKGHIRAVLCNSCNTGLGMFKDNAEVLRKAAHYLENTN